MLIVPAIAQTQTGTGNFPSQRGTYVLLEPLPCLPGATCTQGNQITGVTFGPNSSSTSIQLKDYLLYLLNLLIALSAVMAVFMMVWGGFIYMTSESWTGKGDGVAKFKNAVLGLLLVLSSYLILKTINPQLVQIPTTLVPRLQVQRPPDATQQFFDNLQREASRYSALSQGLRVELEARQAGNVVLEEERLRLIDQITTATGSAPADLRSCPPELRDACLRLAQIEDRQTQNINEGTLAYARGVFAGKVAEALANPRIAGNSFRDSIIEVYDQEILYLKANGATPAQRAILYEVAQFTILKGNLLYAIKQSPGGSSDTIQNAARSAGQIRNPELRKEFAQTLVDIINQVNADQYRSERMTRDRLNTLKNELISTYQLQQQ